MIRKRPLLCEIEPVSKISDRQIEAMIGLFSSYFYLESPECFVRDLKEKDLVFLLYDQNRRIRGFSALAVRNMRYKDKELIVLVSGDTIIDRRYWGGTVLPETWMRKAFAVADSNPNPTYWLLLCGGYRTYRYLPLFLKSYYPSVYRDTPAEMQRLMDALANDVYGPNYIRDEGIVRFSRGATPLRRGVGDINKKKMSNPHISFFCHRNPGHHLGDELLCLALLDRRNLTKAGHRVLNHNR